MENEKKSVKEWVKENKEMIIKWILLVLGTVAGGIVISMLFKGSMDTSDLIDVESAEVSDDDETSDDSTDESEE